MCRKKLTRVCAAATEAMAAVAPKKVSAPPLPQDEPEEASETAKLRQKDYELLGAHYKRMPRDFPEDGPAAEFLLHDGLYVIVEKPATVVSDVSLSAIPAVCPWVVAGVLSTCSV